MEINIDDGYRGFKLLNGTEVIGKLVGETDTHYNIENCLYWDLVQVAEGKYDVDFAPLTVGAKLPENATHPGIDLDMPKTSVLFPYKLRKEIEDKYKRLVSPILM